MTFRFKWQGSPGSAPPQAVAHITASAGWNHASSGTASDGISASDYHEYPGGGGGSPHGSASGEKWEVEDVKSDGTFDVKLSPSASSSGSCSVAVSVEVFGGTIAIDGTVRVGDGLATLIGQQQVGRVSVSGLEPRNHTWSIAGDIQAFKFLDERPDYRKYLGRGGTEINPHPEQKTFIASKPEQETLKCTVDLYDPGTQNKRATVTLERKVQVVAPDATLVIENTSVGFDNGQGGIESHADFEYTANVNHPNLPQGQIALLQKLQENTTYSPRGHFGFATPQLDTAFPYGAESPMGSFLVPFADGDSPLEPFLAGATGVNHNQNFMLTSMFKPTGGVYVPLISKGWSVQAIGNRNASSGDRGMTSGAATSTQGGGAKYVLENAEYDNVARNGKRYDYSTGLELP